MATAPAPQPAELGFRLNFFKLVVSDLEAMVVFYADTFGFVETRRIALPGLEEAMLSLPDDRFTLVLYRHTDGRAIEIGSGHGPVGFLTRDVDAAYAHALASGASDMRAPTMLPGMKLAFVRDPEGHEIEMIQLVRPAAAKE